MKKVAAHTLGCKLNFAETSHLLRQLQADGYEVVDYHQVADLYVINTCTVTSVAEKKCRTAIRQAHQQNPQATVAVIGCFAQTGAQQIAAIPGVDIILGNDRKHLLPQLLRERSIHSQTPHISTPPPLSFQPLYSGDDRTRTFFKIQDGCDYFCTYCAIPFARGRSRSATIAETLAAARQIAASGVQEVVLTGVNTGTFGQQHGETLLELLRQLDALETIPRFRISSIEPNLITTEIIDFVAQSRAFMPHFHIPLQAGSDKVLALMHRRYDTALYANRIQYIRGKLPHACIAADVMAGFNGEDDDTFSQSLAFIESLPLSYLHVFPYSDRPGTAALRLPERLPVTLRRERSAQLQALSDRKWENFVASQMGQTRPVLWEHCSHPTPAGDTLQGWTDNYIRLQRPYAPALGDTITPWTITPQTLA